MIKFSWDDYPGYSTVAMNANGSVYAFSGDIQYDFDEGVWFPLNPARNMVHVFSPASEVFEGVVLPKERPDLPPDWWFLDESGEGQTTDEERFEQLEVTNDSPNRNYLSWVDLIADANVDNLYKSDLELSTLPQDWTSNDTFASSPYIEQDNLARQAIWSHFEEFECLPDFLVGDTEVLGDSFMGIKVIDDEA